MNYDKKVAVWLIILSIITFIIDINTPHTYNCINKKHKNKYNVYYIYILTFIHHLIHYFFMYGWIFNNKFALCLIFLLYVTIIIHWIAYNKCILTETFNKLCNYKDSVYFNDILMITTLKKYNFFSYVIYPIYMIMTLLIIVYKLVYR